MAGIGFSLRRLLRSDSYLGQLQAYGYAGIIGAGPWTLSILGVMLIGVLSLGVILPMGKIIQFLVSITYLMAASLILTGLLQIMFTRFVADRLFEKKPKVILPNLLGALTLTTLVSAGSGLLALTLFPHESLLYRVLMLVNFVVLCNIWIVAIFLSSMKSYHAILGAFFVGYSATVVAALLLRPLGLEGLMTGFLLGQALLLFIMLTLVVRDHPGERLVSFAFLDRRQAFYSLALTGLLFNLGVWADKLIFWMDPITSEPIIGPLRASVVYDLPIFLAYLSIIPGMAIFLVRMETDFAEHYEEFYDAVRGGETLAHIEGLKDQMVTTIRQGIYEIFKVQGLTVVILFLAGPAILKMIGLSPLYIHLFKIDLVAVGVQVLLLSILNVLFYLDKRLVALSLCALFAASNIIFTLLSQYLGPAFYGYGFAFAVTLSSLVGLALLTRKLERLEYETFMLQ